MHLYFLQLVRLVTFHVAVELQQGADTEKICLQMTGFIMWNVMLSLTTVKLNTN